MRREQRRKDVDKVFVLGAGSSFSLSNSLSTGGMINKTTPLDKNFLEVLLEFKDRSNWVEDSVRHIKQNWMDEDDLSKIGLEEAIIKRIGQYEFLYNLHPQKTRNKSSNHVYLNHLSHLIAKMLFKCKANNRDRHKVFIDHVFPQNKSLTSLQNRIITFNYDTIIDNALLMREDITQRHVYFDRLRPNKENDGLRKVADRFDHPLILKLHGSINWNVSTEYFNTLIEEPNEINPDQKEPIWINKSRVPSIFDSVSPLIIPPLPNKPITQVGIFKYLWTTAYEYLHDANEVIIAGYSCPHTDAIAHAMFSHFSNSNIKRVVIIDPDATMLSKYRGLFKSKVSKKVRWQYYENFQEYVDSECS